MPTLPPPGRLKVASLPQRCSFTSETETFFDLRSRKGRGDVIAHQEELVTVVMLGVVKGGFGRREGKDEPAVAGIDRGELEHVAEEGSVGFRVLGVEDDVGSIDHAGGSSSHSAAVFANADEKNRGMALISVYKD